MKLDFLTKEIFVKIGAKFFGVLRIFYLLYFFGTSNILDDFYLANSIIGLVLLINILFETSFSRLINSNRDNWGFLSSFYKKVCYYSVIFIAVLLFISYFLLNEQHVFIHVLFLSLWSLLNISSYFFVLIFRFQGRNKSVLYYYLLFSIFNLLFLISFFEIDLFTKENEFVVISLTIVAAELLTMFIVFRGVLKKMFLFRNKFDFKFDNDFYLIVRVLTILVLISLIDITDKMFLSFLGEGKITIYTYGLYASLIIRQSLDIKSNFFAQINQLSDKKEINKRFYMTLKKTMFFFFLAAILIVVIFELCQSLIIQYDILTFHEYKMVKKVFLVGLVITPFYMAWDLFYRLYYRNDMVNTLLVITFIGFIINLILNYFLSIYMNYDLFGVLLSTLLVFILYNIISYKVFFNWKKD